jgi:hypothetical protein
MHKNYSKHLFILFSLSFFLVLTGCNDSLDVPSVITVNSIEDIANPSGDTVTLRSALASADSGQVINFDSELDGNTIELSIVGEEHTTLKGEVMEFDTENNISVLTGYFDRDYGKSALYAEKDVIIDASELSSGITISWAGNDDARVLAVNGNLTMFNVTVTGGRSIAEDISGTNDEQPWTLARGGAIAVWGSASLVDCKLYDNYCEGDFDSSEDRGTFGGGVYADIVEIVDCIISGNTVYGERVSGGGVFSVGGVETSETETDIIRSSVTGNHITGIYAYGGGVYTDGGGSENSNTLNLNNSTISENKVDFPDDLSPSLASQGYWKGSGVYMSNGLMAVKTCTIVENQVHGIPRTDNLGKKNLAGGIAASVENTHVLEDIIIGHSIIAGNTVHESEGDTYNHDIFTGSAFYFSSMGYNRIGVIDFSQILVPVGEEDWRSLNRKFYPFINDMEGINIADVLDLADGITYSDNILSAGVNEGDPAVLYYEPQGNALDQIPTGTYSVTGTFLDYSIADNATNDFLEIMLDRIEAEYSLTGFAADFTADFETFLNSVDIDGETAGNQPYEDPDGNSILTLTDTQWFGPDTTWPKEVYNYPYIEFWHRLDGALIAENIPGMGPELISDSVWDDLFPSSGALDENDDIEMNRISGTLYSVTSENRDQLNNYRPGDNLGDIGAIEIQ